MADFEAAPEGAEAAAAEPALTPYDRIAYPSTVIQRIDPERLAVIARLHGIDAAPPATARVLEVGGGDGLNLTAFAAAFPQSRCLSFDLASSAVARGQALARAAGIGNVRVERRDIMDAAETLAGEFDYILVHGVYAWVPGTVRDAIMRLVGRVLAPHGVALVSYNALPGQALSQSLRTMAAALVGDVADDEERIDRSIAMLRDYAEGATEADNSFVTALRKRAQTLAGRPRSLLAHDEFGAFFEPQGFSDVADAAAAVGLDYLNDAVNRVWEEGFTEGEEEIDQARLRRAIHAHDYGSGCLFRHSLFVRAGQRIVRRLDPARIEGLWLSSAAQMVEAGKFVYNDEKFEIGDNRMSAILSEVARRYPEQFPLAGLDEERLVLCARLFLGRGVHLAIAPGRAGGQSDRPRLSPLARALIERGDVYIAGLDQSMTPLSEDLRQIMLRFDGHRDAAMIAAEIPGFSALDAVAVTGMAAQRALLAP